MHTTPPVPLIQDSTIESVEFITAKPLLARLDVLPFVALYAIAIGAYLNTVEEWQAIFAMIAILVVFVLHLVILLLGYWHVDIRVRIAYNVHKAADVVKSFQSYNSVRFIDGIRYAQEVYEGQLTSYKMWHSIWSKQLDAQYTVWKKQKEAYERSHNENAIPPGPFVGPEPPKAPVLGSPVALYQGELLQVIVRPHKHSGNPTICNCVFDASDASRIQFTISGLLTPKEIIAGTAAVHNTTSKINLFGPKYCPPLMFSHHHLQYTIDPNAPLTPVKKDGEEILVNTMPNAQTFIPRPYPDTNPLGTYLTHDLTPATTFLVDSTTSQSSDDEDDSTTIKTTKSLHHSHAAFKLLQYGLNSLTVPIPSFIAVFIENAMSPFFVFQIVCILLWMLDEYWYYSLFTLAMIVALECTVVWKRRSHLVQMLGEKPPLPHVYVYRKYDENITPAQIAQKAKKAPKSSKNLKQQVDAIGEWVFTPTKCLVPGDIVALPIYNDREQIVSVFGAKDDESQQNCPSRTHRDYLDYKSGRPTLYTTEIPCDLLLLSGSCVADESMLTGESVPQIKEDLISLSTYSDDTVESADTINELAQNLNNQSHKRHVLYSGTKLIGIQRSYDFSALSANHSIHDDESTDDVQKYDLLGSLPPLPSSMDIVLTRVIRTGFSTTQGSLVRTILTASDNVLIDKEALYFILGLLCCAIISAYHVLMQGLADPTRSRYKLMLNVITILTSVVPPELPMQLSMAVNNALALLAKTGVFCIEPNRIPAAGQVNVCCFDKTGTLTSDEFLLTCAVTHDSASNSGEDKFTMMRSDLNKVNLADNGDDSDEADDNELQNLKASALPIDMRLVMGCANELTMLQLPAKKTAPNEKPAPTQRIIGDPMEAVAFSSAGFHFLSQKQPKDVESGPNKDSSGNKMFCDAAPVVFDNHLQTYHTPKSIQLPASLQGVANLGVKTRVESEVIHRFTFQSQLQRMSSVICVNLPQYSKQSQIPTSFTAGSIPAEWLNSSLPTTELQNAASTTFLRSVVKGSPECIYNLLDPRFRPSFESYTEQHKSLARQGLRVLALAWKPMFIDTTNDHNVLCDVDLEKNNPAVKGSVEYSSKLPAKMQTNWLHHIKVPSREYSENNLFFVGIIGFNSPLKTQSQEVITHLQQSAHKTICITGDHLLTAIAVAKQLGIAKKDCLLLSSKHLDDDSAEPQLQWINEREEFVKPFLPDDAMFEDLYALQKTLEPNTPLSSLPSTYQNTSLCINGDAFKQLVQHHPSCLPLLCSITSVFARTLPCQKELILKNIKEHDNQHVSFVGDGTNDIGALSHAHIGIALLSIDTDSKEQLSAAEEKLKEMNKNPAVKRLLESAQKLREKGFTAKAEELEQSAHNIHKRLKQSQLGSLLDGMDEDDDSDGSVKLGDASLAAAFSAKHGSIRCLLDVIRQGRCALATTGQMYQILALQCLIAAYSLSALYFQGVRQSESQMTIGGLLNAAMSMLLSYAQPLEKVSPRRPNSKIFSPYNITSIVLQFIIHLGILMYMVNEAMVYTSTDSLKLGQDETITTYTPSVLNTVVFVLSTAMGATTILSNYVGYPFMTPLTWTPLFKVILGTLLFCVTLSLENMPDINEMLEMSPMPTPEFGFNLATCIIIDCVGCVFVGLATKLFFGIVTWDDLTKPIPKDVISHSVQKKPSTPAPTSVSQATSSTNKKQH